jgi:hypothetical protein
MNKKVLSYQKLVEKYPNQWVALTLTEDKVVAADKNYNQLREKLRKKHRETTEVVFTKLEKPGLVSVYCQISLSI